MILRGSIVVILLICCVDLVGQTDKLRGYIFSQSTGEAISFGTAQIGQRGSITNDQGYFSLTGRWATSDTLKVSALGYESVDIALSDVNVNEVLRFNLRNTQLQTIIVAAHRKEPTVLSPSISRLKSLPVVLGQTDLIKGLTFFPGIAGGREGLSGLHVRGGSDDQNLYLLDGSAIYQPGHLFGFLSVFNPNIVRSIDVYKDYIPGRYSRRLSSTLKVQTRQGSRGRQRSKEFGLLGLSYTDIGSFRDTTLQYAFGGRMSHSAVLSVGTLPAYLASDNPLLFAGMYDLNAKITKRLPEGRLLAGSVYFGDDGFGGLVKTEEEGQGSSSGLYYYGNKTASIRYFSPLRMGGFSESLLNFSRYASGYRIQEKFTFPGQAMITNIFRNRSQIREVTSTHNRSYLSSKAEVDVGAFAAYRVVEPDRFVTSQNGQVEAPPRFNFRNYTVSTYIDSKFQASGTIALQTGFRLSYYGGQNLSVVELDPRLRLGFAWGKSGTLGLNLFRTSQPLHAISTAAGGLPNAVWLPSTGDAPPQVGWTYSADYHLRRHQSDYSVSLFYRTMRNLVYLGRDNLVGANNDAWTGQVATDGHGEAYGLELSADVQISYRWAILAAYTYSRSKRRFEDVNDNRWFPYDFDRPHDFNINAQYTLTQRWKINLTFVGQTGRPITISEATALNFFGNPKSVVLRVNQQRFPVYHRADLLIERKRITKKDRAATLRFGVYNTYGNINPVYLFTNTRITSASSPSGNQRVYIPRIEYGALFRFLPMLSYEVKY